MSLARNKKGIELITIIEIILVVIATGLLIGIFNYAAGRADEKTAETLCRGFNALRFGTEIETPIGNINVAPRACRTIDKKEVPSKDYKNHIGGMKEGAKAEIRDLMTKCWNMWLEGNKKNMFGSEWYNLENGCFVCYTFSIDKDVKEHIKYSEFAASLNTPYYAVDSSDRCAPAGQGGYCRPSCDKSTDFSREVASNKCPLGQKCCIDEDRRNECKNKGGKCLDEPSGEFTEPYIKWQCKTGNCYLKKEKISSYLDYIQGTKGVGGGAGAVIFGDDAGFSSGSKYAVTFISPGNSWNWNTVFGIAVTAGLGAGTGAVAIVGISSGIGAIPILVLLKSVIVGGLLTTASGYITGATGDVRDINIIMLSKYDTVSAKCAIEAGVGEK